MYCFPYHDSFFTTIDGIGDLRHIYNNAVVRILGENPFTLIENIFRERLQDLFLYCYPITTSLSPEQLIEKIIKEKDFQIHDIYFSCSDVDEEIVKQMIRTYQELRDMVYSRQNLIQEVHLAEYSIFI